MWIVCRDGSEPQGGKPQAAASLKKRRRPLNTAERSEAGVKEELNNK